MFRKADHDVLKTKRHHAGQNLFRGPSLERFSSGVLFANILILKFQTTYGTVTTFLYTLNTFHLWSNVTRLYFHCYQTQRLLVCMTALSLKEIVSSGAANLTEQTKAFVVISETPVVRFARHNEAIDTLRDFFSSK